MWGPSRLRENRMRRPENGFCDLPSFLRHAGCRMEMATIFSKQEGGVCNFSCRWFLCPQILHLYLSIRLLPQRVQHASAYPSSNLSHNKFHLLYTLLVSSHTNKSTKDNLKFHSQHSSTGSPTIVYFKLAQLSRRKGHNKANSQAHSQA